LNGGVQTGQLGVSEVARVADTLLRYERAAQERTNRIDALVKKEHGLMVRTRMNAGSGMPDFSKDAEIVREEIRGLLLDENRVLGQNEIAGLIQFIPQKILFERKLEVEINWRDRLAFDLGKVGALFTDAIAFRSSIQAQVSSLRELLTRFKLQQMTASEIYHEANAAWQRRELASSFAKMSTLLEIGDTSDERIRIGYGMLGVKINIESIRRFTSAAKDPRSENQNFDLPLGCTKEIYSKAVSVSSPTPTGTFQISTKHSGRVGAIDGLAVRASDGSGVVSPKSIQLLPKSETAIPSPSKDESNNSPLGRLSKLGQNLTPDSPGEQIEVHGGDIRLDISLIASVKDSLRFVTQMKCPELLSKHRISVVFDSTSNVAHGGDSAGAAFALAAISAYQKIVPSPDVCVTGAIRPYGDISPVGGIYPKTAAAISAGYKIVLIPEANAGEIQVFDFESMGPIQVIVGKSLDDYMDVVFPTLGKHAGEVEWAKRAYSVAYVLYKRSAYSEAKSVLKSISTAFPRHLSAKMLLSRLELAGIVAGDPGIAIQELLKGPHGTTPLLSIAGNNTANGPSIPGLIPVETTGLKPVISSENEKESPPKSRVPLILVFVAVAALILRRILS
jgi:hypothetical protein